MSEADTTATVPAAATATPARDRALKSWGGRKWMAFLLLTAIFVGFVLGGYLKNEENIKYILISLLGVYGGVNLGEKVVAALPDIFGPKKEEKKTV